MILGILKKLFVGEQRAPDPAQATPQWMDDPAAIVPALRQAIRRDDAAAMTVYGSMLGLGLGVEEDREECALWLRQAAVRGDPAGQAAFGTCLAKGIGLPKPDYKEAAFWLWQATKQGVFDAAKVLRTVILIDQSVVGEHFTHTDFYRAYADLRRRATQARRQTGMD